MIITLKGCTATAFIGGLNFFKVSRGTVSGATVTIATSTVNKDEATSTSAREIATVVLNSNYENLVVIVTMGGTTVNWFANGKVTIPANTAVTGDIKISASATAIQVTPPSGGDTPTQPTTYTFTINPTPSTAIVTLTASGYTQSGNSITVPSGTSVTWKVSATGYTEQNGTHTVTKNESKSVTLSGTAGSDGNSIDLSTLTLGHCSSAKMTSGSKENLAYDQSTHILTCANKGWYKCSYFNNVNITNDMEIEFEAYNSATITGNYFGIWSSDELVDGIAEVKSSFWPAATFGIYASGGTATSTPEPLYLWDLVDKTKIEGSLATDFNNKTIKYVIDTTGNISVYVDGVQLELPRAVALNSSKTYYFGLRHTANSTTTPCSKMLYIGPRR